MQKYCLFLILSAIAFSKIIYGAPEIYVGDVRSNDGPYYSVENGVVNLDSNRGWNFCYSGYVRSGIKFDSDGFWLCVRSDLKDSKFFVGDVRNDRALGYMVEGGTTTYLGDQFGWNQCPFGKRIGTDFHSNGFWVCFEEVKNYEAEYYIGDVRNNTGYFYKISEGGVEFDSNRSWNYCPSGYRRMATVFNEDGFWFCAKDSLSQYRFVINDVKEDTSFSYEVIPDAEPKFLGTHIEWSNCIYGSFKGQHFDSDGFWFCVDTSSIGPDPIDSWQEMEDEKLVLTKLSKTKVGCSEVANNELVGTPLYYLPKLQNGSNLNRFNSGGEPYLSKKSSIPGYTFEQVLGQGWLYQCEGTVEIYQSINSNSGCVTVPSITESPGGNLDYTGLFAYPYYEVNQLECLDNNVLRICSNKKAGGTVWNVRWNGKEFIDTYDYGRQIQSSLGQTGNGLPTEGGANFGREPPFQNGSPLASFTTDSSNHFQSTRSIPLDFYAFNGEAHEPRLFYRWRIGKDIWLDPSDIDLGTEYNYLKKQTIRYETVLNLPNQLGGGAMEPGIETPTGYMPNEFDRFFKVDATQSDTNVGLTEIENKDMREIIDGNNVSVLHYETVIAAGGVIMASENLNYAMGIYTNDSTFLVNGDINLRKSYTLWKFGGVNKWAVGNKGILPRGESRFRTYIVVGTLDEVRTAMRRLYMKGY